MKHMGKINMKNKKYMLLFTGFFAVLLFLVSKQLKSLDLTKPSPKIINEKMATGSGDNPYARLDYEFQRTKDPETGRVPYRIREKELSYAKTLPNREEIGWSQGERDNRTVSWDRRGPFNVGGRTRALAIDINNENIILAGGVSGGMWRSTDDGESWTMTTEPGDLHSVTAIAQDPSSPNIWYYGTGEKSGNSAQDASGGGALYLGNGIYKSEDGGESWDRLTFTASDIPNEVSRFDYTWTIKVSPVNGYVYVATWQGIERSTNGGETFEKILVPTDYFPSYTDIDITTDGQLCATIGSIGSLDYMTSVSGVHVSEDNGDSWISITPSGFPSFYKRIVLDISDDNSVIYFLGHTSGDQPTDHFLWQYTIASDSWDNRSENIPAYGGDVGNYDSQGSYDMVIKVKSDDPDFVVIGGTNLYRSTDGFSSSDNTSWIGGYSPANDISQYENHHPDQHALVFNGTSLLSGHDGGISKTDNISQNDIVWSSLSNGYYTTQFYHVSIDPSGKEEHMIIGGMQDNGTWAVDSNSESANWNEVYSGDGGYSAIAHEGAVVIASSQNGNTLIMKSDGSAWAQLNPENAIGMVWITPFILDASDEDIFYYAGGQTIWRNDGISDFYNDGNEDMQSHWVELTATSCDEPVSALASSKNSPSHRLYYGTSNGEVWKLDGADEGGTSGESQNITSDSFPEGFVSWISVNPSDGDETVVTFSNYGVISVWHTADAGDNWTNISGNLEENSDGTGYGPSVRTSFIMPYDGEVYYFLGTSIGVYSTDELDGNNTVWALEGSDLMGNVVVDALVGREGDGYIVAATHGIGVYSATLDSWASVQSETALPEQFVLHQNYPNPFNPTTTIKYELFQSSQVTISVYDMLGRFVKTLVNSTQEPGVKTIQWDAKDEQGNRISAGVYIYKLKSGDFMETKEMILLK